MRILIFNINLNLPIMTKNNRGDQTPVETYNHLSDGILESLHKVETYILEHEEFLINEVRERAIKYINAIEGEKYVDTALKQVKYFEDQGQSLRAIEVNRNIRNTVQDVGVKGYSPAKRFQYLDFLGDLVAQIEKMSGSEATEVIKAIEHLEKIYDRKNLEKVSAAQLFRFGQRQEVPDSEESVDAENSELESKVYAEMESAESVEDSILRLWLENNWLKYCAESPKDRRFLEMPTRNRREDPVKAQESRAAEMAYDPRFSGRGGGGGGGEALESASSSQGSFDSKKSVNPSSVSISPDNAPRPKSSFVKRARRKFSSILSRKDAALAKEPAQQSSSSSGNSRPLTEEELERARKNPMLYKGLAKVEAVSASQESDDLQKDVRPPSFISSTADESARKAAASAKKRKKKSDMASENNYEETTQNPMFLPPTKAAASASQGQEDSAPSTDISPTRVEKQVRDQGKGPSSRR
jgi:hypothetical protein